MRIPLVPLLFLISTIAVSAQSRQPKQPVPVTGTRVSLVPPSGFTPATQFSGFQQEETGASILVVEGTGPYSQVSAGFADSARLLSRGILLRSRQKVTIQSFPGTLIQLRQSAHGTTYLKWGLVFGDETESVMITASFPEEHEAELSEKLRSSLLTAVWEKKKAVPKREGLNFKVDESGDLAFAQRMANTLAYSRQGKFPLESPYDPLFIVGQSISKTVIEDYEQYTRDRLLATGDVVGIQIEQITPLEIDSLGGYEIIALARDRDSGEPTLLYQVMLYEVDSYYIMHGRVGADSRETYIEAFRSMAHSFRRE